MAVEDEFVCCVMVAVYRFAPRRVRNEVVVRCSMPQLWRIALSPIYMSAHRCVSPERIYVYTNNRGGSESSSAMQLCVTRNRYGFAYLLPSVTVVVFESSLKPDFWLPLYVENSTTLFTTHGNVKIYIGAQKDLCRCYYPFLINGFGLFILSVVLCLSYLYIIFVLFKYCLIDIYFVLFITLYFRTVNILMFMNEICQLYFIRN